MTLHSLPLFVRLAGRPVILLGDGEAAAAKRRLLERAGAAIVGEDAATTLAIVALDDPDAAVARLRARGILVNAVDRPDLCDFTLPAIVDRDPVIVAIGTGGASAGLAAALRQRLEGMLSPRLGALARLLQRDRDRLRAAFPDGADRRRGIAAALAEGGPLDLADPDLGDADWIAAIDRERPAGVVRLRLASVDPDDLTLRQARLLAGADRVTHRPDVPVAILNRARADAIRIACPAPPVDAPPGRNVDVEILA